MKRKGLLTVEGMSRYQAYRWLLRHDDEAWWHWTKCFIKGADLREDVNCNYGCYGATHSHMRGAC
jgi:hypothetical protein